jgi:hypothetical protein
MINLKLTKYLYIQDSGKMACLLYEDVREFTRSAHSTYLELGFYVLLGEECILRILIDLEIQYIRY